MPLTPPEHNYVNDTVIAANRDSRKETSSLFDAFDMRKHLLFVNYIN